MTKRQALGCQWAYKNHLKTGPETIKMLCLVGFCLTKLVTDLNCITCIKMTGSKGFFEKGGNPVRVWVVTPKQCECEITTCEHA